MSADELSDWEAYHYFEPWGTPAEDDRWRIFYELMFKANFKGEEPNWLDRDPEMTWRKRRAEEAKLSLADKLDAFFGARAIEVQIVEEQPPEDQLQLSI